MSFYFVYSGSQMVRLGHSVHCVITWQNKIVLLYLATPETEQSNIESIFKTPVPDFLCANNERGSK